MGDADEENIDVRFCSLTGISCRTNTTCVTGLAAWAGPATVLSSIAANVRDYRSRSRPHAL